MKKTQYSKLRLGAAPLVLSVALVSAPAFAQDAAEEGATAQSEIVVTGSLIRNPNLESASPVNVTTEDEIKLRQSTSAELLLRETPGVVANLGSNVNNGSVGSSRVDLRGLGAQRNLVMLNSTRIVPSSTFGAVDLNNIPVALIERVDVLTGGASTTYGADAVTGVVNFITKRDFAGIDLSATQQLSERGDANLFSTDLVIGANFDDGRGNAVLSLGYTEADKLLFGARPQGQCVINSFSGACGGDSPTASPTSFAIPGQTNNMQIGPDGQSLVPQYSLYNFNPANIYITPYRRFNMYGEARYDVSDSVTVYGRGLFSKNTVDTEIASSGIFGEELTVAGNNPFLPAGIRDQLCTFSGIALGASCNNNTAIPLGAVYRRSVELGPRKSRYVTNIFDMKAGATFNITDKISFDIYGAYGESENTETRSGYVAKSRVIQALDAVDATTCTDPSGGCVPLNIFGGLGSITPEMGAFVGGLTSSIQQYSSLAQVHGVLSGSTGFALPWASEEVSFAIGGEYRDYFAAQRPDNLAQVPGELGGAGGAVVPFEGGYNATEAFGELIIPLVSDKPFFDELTLEGGIRYSHYEVAAPNKPSFNATSWKVGVNWAPADAIKFRGNYQKAVRAPNIGELFAPTSTGLTNLATDPCSGTKPGTVGGANTGAQNDLWAVCLAQGANPAARGTIADPASGQANVTGGGNTNLKPETAKTLTVGVVLTPRDLVPGFTLSFDYYRIKVTNAITAPLPDDIISACFDSITAASATDPACTTIRRNPASSRLSGSPATTPGLPAPLTNAGRLLTDGFDLVANYKRNIGFADLALNFSGNYTKSAKFAASPTTGYGTNCPGIYSANCGLSVGQLQPKWSWSQRTTLSFDKIDISLLWRHVSSFKYEFIGTPDELFEGQITGIGPLVGKQVNLNRIPSYDYFDLTTRFAVTDNFDLTLTAFNLLDKKPPLVGNQAGTTTAGSGNTFPSTYDVVGRRYSATARLRF